MNFILIKKLILIFIKKKKQINPLITIILTMWSCIIIWPQRHYRMVMDSGNLDGDGRFDIPKEVEKFNI